MPTLAKAFDLADHLVALAQEARFDGRGEYLVKNTNLPPTGRYPFPAAVQQNRGGDGREGRQAHRGGRDHFGAHFSNTLQ